MGRSKKNNFDNQLDLTPFISLLSVCICFLLVTVAWYQVGSLSMKQVMGGDMSQASTEKKRSLWIVMEPQNVLLVKIKKGDRELNQKTIKAEIKEQEKHFDFNTFKVHISSLKKQMPDLNQAFILPEKNTVYEDLIKVMDGVRQVGIFNLGVSPI